MMTSRHGNMSEMGTSIGGIGSIFYEYVLNLRERVNILAWFP